MAKELGGLDGVKLIVGAKCLGILEAVGEVYPENKYQRCVVHFYRNGFSVVPRSKVNLVSKMLQAIHLRSAFGGVFFSTDLGQRRIG